MYHCSTYLIAAHLGETEVQQDNKTEPDCQTSVIRFESERNGKIAA